MVERIIEIVVNSYELYERISEIMKESAFILTQTKYKYCKISFEIDCSNIKEISVNEDVPLISDILEFYLNTKILRKDVSKYKQTLEWKVNLLIKKFGAKF